MKKCISRFCNGLKGSVHGLNGFVFCKVLFLCCSIIFFSCNQTADLSRELEESRLEQKKNQQKIDELQALLDAANENLDEKDTLLNGLTGSAGYAKLYAEITGLSLDHTYVGAYDKFRVDSDGKISYWGMWGTEPTDMDTIGYIQKLILPEGYAGCIAIIKCEHHTNWGHYQYPDYDEQDEDNGENCYGMGCFCHHDCYVPFYVRPDGDGFYMAQAIWNGVEGSNGAYTACAKTLEQVLYLFDTYGYDSTCANLFSSYSRNVLSVIPKGILRGEFNY